MRRTLKVLVQLFAVLAVSICPVLSSAQTPKPPSLEEQLRAQYEPGTILTLRKAGILAVAPASTKVCPARYQDGKINPAEPACLASLSGGTRILTAGEKINPSNVDVDLTKETISFRIVECDSCNRVSQPSSYKSQIDFQFAKGYLEQASVPQVVDTISEVLAFPEVAQEQPSQPLSPPGQPGGQSDDGLTNNDIVKMAKVKLGDGIIISKIKTSAPNFDLGVDALVKLKEAGVSDPVIQAMHDAKEAAKAAENPPARSPEPQPDSTATGNPAPGSYAAALHNGTPALVFGVGSSSSFTVDLVDHDGERALRLRVQHNHLSLCAGYLYISHNHIAYDPVETPNSQKDAFDLKRADVKKAAATKFKVGGHPAVGIWTEKKNYFFVPLTDVAPGVDLRQNRCCTFSDENVYDFIGRSLTDFDSVLHEAETLTASLTQRP